MVKFKEKKVHEGKIRQLENLLRRVESELESRKLKGMESANFMALKIKIEKALEDPERLLKYKDLVDEILSMEI